MMPHEKYESSLTETCPFLPCFLPVIFHPDFEANRLKSLGLRADDFLHPDMERPLSTGFLRFFTIVV